MDPVIGRRCYPSDLTDNGWARIRTLVIPGQPRGGRPCAEVRWREHVNALPYVVRTGCPWRSLLHDFTVSRSATHEHFTKWTRTGLWHQLLRTLREEARTRAGRKKEPTAAVVDSSSVKGMPVAGPRGFNGAKKIDGIKRHILMDTTACCSAYT